LRIALYCLALCILLIFLVLRASQSCTTFCLDKGDQLVFGKNQDSIDSGLMIVNKRGVLKTAKVNDKEPRVSQPVSWTSQYGSVTFNRFGREQPFGGMNEAGLVVEQMTLFETKYPGPDLRPYINSGQWIQYQLDNSSMVEEVIASDSKLRITDMLKDPGQHFLVSDRRGNCAAIEFINGKLVHYTEKSMPIKVLSNRAYAECITYWEQSELPIWDYSDAVKRFAKAADMVKHYNPVTSGPAVDYAFDILKNVTMRGTYLTTGRSIVYDIKNLRVYFRTFEKEQIRYADLSSFDFSCKTPVKVLYVNEDLRGDVSKNFVNYTYEINRDLIKNAIPDISDEDLNALAHYPETTNCTEVLFTTTIDNQK